MKIESAIMGMFISEDGTRIEIKDKKAATTFAIIKLTPEQLSCLLSRRSDTPCDVEVFSLDRIGKIHEHQTFEFQIGKPTWDKRHPDALETACYHYLYMSGLKSDGWIPDLNFNSQNSFFTKQDGSYWARTTIRRWI